MGWANHCNFCGNLDELFDSADINIGWVCADCIEEHEKG